jgi:capsular polysaccharide export protein
MSNKRHYLFLQGLATPFLGRLARRLKADGYAISRINFCPGDALYWGLGGSVAFRGRRSQFADFFDALLKERKPTDLVLFGDSRPLHRLAIKNAKEKGLRVHVFEEGYIRPDWITLERDGVNASSPLPSDPLWYRKAWSHLRHAPEPKHVPTPLAVRAAQDMAFHLANIAAPFAYRHYRTHRPRPPALEYAGWAWRFSRFPVRRAREQRRLDALLEGLQPLFFLPLQLTGDSQLVRNSPFRSVAEVIEVVMRSFAGHAPSNAELLVKNHPLDTGFDRHERTVRKFGRELGLEKRVHFFESGNLPTLFNRVRGTVVVNSTVGLVALTYGCPVKALAHAIYSIPGLTSGDSLDDFWKQPSPPDETLVKAFRDTVLCTTQINGNFFTAEGIRLAIEHCLPMLTGESPLEELKQSVAGTRNGLVRLRGHALRAAAHLG